MKTMINKYSIPGKIPPIILIGAMIVLFPIFAYMTFENINRQKDQNIKMLIEKSAALIRAFEAGTRTGMMGMHWNKRSLQNLLTETATQPDIKYLLVTDKNGIILAHNDPQEIGQGHGKGLDFKEIAQSKELKWRILKSSTKHTLFEVYKKFSPTSKISAKQKMRHMHKMPHRMNLFLNESPIIFVGLDIHAIKEAEKNDMNHTLIMAVILLFMGISGIVIVFLTQRYQSTKSSLSKIKIFSDTMVENMPIGIIAIDKENTIVSINPTAVLMLKSSADEIIGKDANDCLPKEILGLITDSFIKNGVIEREIECKLNKDHKATVEASSALLKGEQGASLGVVILCKDITELKTLRKEIMRNQRMASIGRLAAGVAHEIRNPLSSIKGVATYFKSSFEFDTKKQNLSDIMIKEIDRLNKVINQLIEIARPVTISSRPVDVHSLIKDTILLIETKLAEKDIQLQTDLADDIKKINIDEDRIKQVLLNLVFNGIESIEGKKGKIQVRLFRSKADQVVIQIIDSGIGIDDENLQHIFDPYFTTKKTGTGLGLAIVQNIIEAHNGEITVESEPNMGTQFSVYLPIEKISE